jgi:hypothetical protein
LRYGKGGIRYTQNTHLQYARHAHIIIYRQMLSDGPRRESSLLYGGDIVEGEENTVTHVKTVYFLVCGGFVGNDVAAFGGNTTVAATCENQVTVGFIGWVVDNRRFAWLTRTALDR